jgi:hypothetical protein
MRRKCGRLQKIVARLIRNIGAGLLGTITLDEISHHALVGETSSGGLGCTILADAPIL